MDGFTLKNIPSKNAVNVFVIYARKPEETRITGRYLSDLGVLFGFFCIFMRAFRMILLFSEGRRFRGTKKLPRQKSATVSDCRKTPEELERAEALSNSNRTRRRVRRGRAIFAAGNPISQSKNRFLAVFAPGNLKDFSKNWRGWQWRGSLLPRTPACQKDFFDKLRGHVLSKTHMTSHFMELFMPLLTTKPSRQGSPRAWGFVR